MPGRGDRRRVGSHYTLRAIISRLPHVSIPPTTGNILMLSLPVGGKERGGGAVGLHAHIRSQGTRKATQPTTPPPSAGRGIGMQFLSFFLKVLSLMGGFFFFFSLPDVIPNSSVRPGATRPTLCSVDLFGIVRLKPRRVVDQKSSFQRSTNTFIKRRRVRSGLLEVRCSSTLWTIGYYGRPASRTELNTSP